MAMSTTVDCTPEGPVLTEGEERAYQCSSPITLHMGEENLGAGTLYTTTRRVVWVSAEDSSVTRGFDMPYILLHAVQRDPEAFPDPCIYCQLDAEEGETYEARFVPSDSNLLMEVFNAFSACAALNPDEEEEGEGEWMYNEDEVEEGARQASVLEHLDSVLHVDDRFAQAEEGQFDDADDDEEEEEEPQENGVAAP